MSVRDMLCLKFSAIAPYQYQDPLQTRQAPFEALMPSHVECQQADSVVVASMAVGRSLQKHYHS
jgi:hypothetical protein